MTFTAAHRDFHIGDVRRLEVSAQRRQSDYLTMMPEEVPRDDDSKELMVGRCIHLDTRATVDTSVRDARLQHLDLAISLSRRASPRTDKQQSRKWEGSRRDLPSHLYSVEDVPFPTLFTFA